MKELGPFVNRDWLPVRAQPTNSTRTKFTPIDDRLLLLGLNKFGSKKLDQIRDFFLDTKTTREIKNRYKNLIRKKAVSNVLKTWKSLEYAPLTELERINLAKGIMWFGEETWTRISKYFLPKRSSHFLKM